MSQALAAHFTHDELLPRPHGGLGRGAVLALLAHGALVLALTSTVQWRTRPPEVFSAELWAAVPQAAAPLPAPAPVAPPPPPPAVAAKPEPVAPPVQPPPAKPAPVQRDADIATEQARKLEAQLKEEEAAKAAKADKAAKAEKAKAAEAERKAQEAERAKAERAKAEADAKAKREAEAKKAEDDKRKAEARKQEEAERKAAAEAKAEDERLAKQREENLRRMMGQAGKTGTATSGPTGTGGTGAAAQGGAPSAEYAARLIKLIRDNIVFTGQVEGNPSAEVEVRAAAGGSIISRRLVKSSGNKDYDEAVLRAVDRTATLPRDNDGRVPPALTLVFRPGG